MLENKDSSLNHCHTAVCMLLASMFYQIAAYSSRRMSSVIQCSRHPNYVFPMCTVESWSGREGPLQHRLIRVRYHSYTEELNC